MRAEKAVSINMKFYGASKGDLGANVPKHADYLFHVPQLFGTGHLEGKNDLFLHFSAFRHFGAKYQEKSLDLVHSILGGERVMASCPLGGDMYRLLLGGDNLLLGGDITSK